MPSRSLDSLEDVQTVIDALDYPVFIKDAAHAFVMVNSALCDVLDLPRDKLLRKSEFDFQPAEQAQRYWRTDDEVLATGSPSQNEELLTDGAGRTRTIVTTKRLIHVGPNGGTPYIIGVVADVTSMRESEARVTHLALHDPLTDLGNRALLRQRLDQALTGARRQGQRVAVLCIDLDHFKSVNDLLGHTAGDQLLREAARRLRATVRETDSVARLSGDEFVIVQSGVGQPADAERLAARVVTILSEDFSLDRGELAALSASVGVAMFPEDGGDIDILLARADAALHRVKENGRNGFAFFQADMDADVRDRRALERDLRLAIQRGEFTLAYQPQADALTGRVVGFEALLRWNSAERGSVPPADFIPVAEACGAIISIGAWVVETACAEAMRWRAPLRVAVNVSAAQIQHGDFAAIVETALARSGLEPGRLEIEVTESLLIRNPTHALQTLRRLKARGVSIALDDFGTGYSSLTTLRSFDFDRVKIDRSFIKDLPESQGALTIVRAVLGLGRGLGLPVVAEGVETQEQLTLLQAEGCAEVQGYLIARPHPIQAHRAITHPSAPRGTVKARRERSLAV